MSDVTTHTRQTTKNTPQLDLTPIRLKVARENAHLTAEQLDDLEDRYLKFLMLCRDEPNVRHEPEKDVDLYWHAHILHTKQYAADCYRYFGYFLHHEPNANGEGCDDGCGAVQA
jgi:hypothetical protein